LHHRRALRARIEGDTETADRETLIASRFERRAQIKIQGAPMPAELRTPTEGILRVEQFRRQIVDVLYLAADITAAEWTAFDQAIAAGLDAPPGQPFASLLTWAQSVVASAEAPATRLEALRRMIASWGVTFGPPLTIARADGELETSAAGNAVAFVEPRLPTADWPAAPPGAKSAPAPAPAA
jgi:hypothetical protein